MSTPRMLLVAVCAAAALSACGSAGGGTEGTGGSGSSATPAEGREQAIGLARELVTPLQEAGFDLRRASGEFLTCRSEPAPGVTYDISLTLRGDGSSEDQVRRVAEVMVGAGWTDQDAGSASSASLLRDDARASVGASRDPGAVALALRGPCTDVDLAEDEVPMRRSEDLDLG